MIGASARIFSWQMRIHDSQMDFLHLNRFKTLKITGCLGGEHHSSWSLSVPNQQYPIPKRKTYSYRVYHDLLCEFTYFSSILM